MCGIIGAIAQRNIADIMLEGLKRLEYRGYDSAGLAVIDPGSNTVMRLRAAGKVERLAERLAQTPLNGHTGIAHTRWATHGKPSEKNAHPHCSEKRIAVVHNGIIENHEALREELQQKGYVFCTDTDTEVIVHLLNYFSQSESSFLEAIKKATNELSGAYALGIITADEPETLYAVRSGSPLVIGVGIGEHFIASDPLALLPVTQRFMYLEEGDIAKITRHSVDIIDIDRHIVSREVHTSDADYKSTSKGQYRHFMLKEIFEQPDSILETINGHILNDAVSPCCFGHKAEALLPSIKNIQIIACGTSYHAGLVAKQWIESIAKIPCQVDIASEFRYRDPIVLPNTLLVALSQSGETADTLAALRLGKQLGAAATLGICNVPESSLAREADLFFLTRAGAEVGVAATKTFTAQLTALLLLTLCLAEIAQPNSTKTILKSLSQLPKLIEKTLALDKPIKKLAHEFARKNHALFLGRGIHYPIALEGALKLKEISYVHAEAYPAGELKHGPLALVDEDMPVIVLAPKNSLIEKLESNIQEVQARQGELYLFIDEAVTNWKPDPSAQVITMPSTPEILTPIIYTIPMQLLSYHIAVLKGTDVDHPRNLAKSVTVE